MTETFLAEAAIEVGHHETAKWFGLTVNTDTVLATAIAAVIVIALAFFLRAKVTSTGVPGGVQLFWEAITVQLRDQIETAIGMKIAPFVLPLAVTLFVFILVANWLSVLPVQYTDGTAPPTSCSSRRQATSTSCWRSPCSYSSATTRQASGAAASSGTP